MKWIDVKEKLPTIVGYGDCKRYLIWDMGVEIAYWVNGNWAAHPFGHSLYTPTHWMPLPEPPNEQES